MTKHTEEKNIQQENFSKEKAREIFELAVLDALDEKKYSEVKELLSILHPADFADFIDKISSEQREVVLEIFKDAFHPEILVELEDVIRAKVFNLIGIKESTKLISNLNSDDQVHVLINLEEELRNELLKNLGNKKSRKEIEEVLNYPKNSAGRIMQRNVVTIPEYWTVGQTIDFLRQNKNLPSEFYEIFVINPKRHPVGGVLVSTIMHHQRNVIINDIMKRDLVVVDTLKHQEEVSYLFRQYGLVSVPVVNSYNKLVGILTISDIVEVINKEAEENIMHLGGIDDVNIHAGILETVKSRAPWLLVNMCTSSLTAYVIFMFGDSIEKVVLLASVAPVVASLGGNAGTQTLTISVLALNDKEVTGINAMRVISKQILSSAASGFVVAAVGGILLLAWQHNIYLSIIFSTSIIINFSVAGFFGSFIPILLDRIGADPSISSPIFLSAMTDLTGFCTFLSLATWLLL